MEEEFKSKTQLKREASALQELGEQLCALPDEKIRALDIPEDIREAALFSKTIKKHEARRRHMQYMGKMMRAEDNVEDIEQAIAYVDVKKRKEDDRFHDLERLRDRLVDGDDDAVGEVMERFGDVDVQRLRQLARNAAKERATNKPPKAFRSLFKYLRELMEQ